MRRKLTRATLIGLACLLVALIAARSGMASGLARALADLGRLRPEAIGLALAFGVLSTLINGAVWTRLLCRLGHNVPTRVGVAAFVSAGLAGYLVSAAGPALGCAVSLRKHGICPSRAVLLSLMANALGFCGVLVWAPIGLLLLSATGMDATLPLLGRYGPTMAAGALVGLGIAMVVVLHALANAHGAGSALARRFLGRHVQPAATTPVRPVRTRHLLALVPLTAGAWLSGTLALYVILGALNPSTSISLGTVIGAAALATTLGSLAFFVPDGMGVRDGVLVALLAHSGGIPLASCTAAAIMVRALDPLTKLGILLLTVSGIERAPLWGALRRRAPHRPSLLELDLHAEHLPHLPSIGLLLSAPEAD